LTPAAVSASSEILREQAGYSLAPVTMLMPICVSAVESAAAVVPVAPTVIAKPWTEENTDHWRREEDWSRRRRRIVVTGRGRAVRLNYFGARIRPHNGSKAERKHRQCYHNKFFPHDQMFLRLFGRLNTMITAKLPKNLEVYSGKDGDRSQRQLRNSSPTTRPSKQALGKLSWQATTPALRSRSLLSLRPATLPALT
jgi:hypothetical protein